MSTSKLIVFLVLIAAQIFLSIAFRWGSYPDHLFYDQMYDGSYYYDVGPFYDVTIWIGHLFSLPSEGFWKINGLVSSAIISAVSISLSVNAFASLIAAPLLLIMVVLPLALFNIRAGQAIAFAAVSIYLYQRSSKRQASIVAVVASIVHFQVLPLLAAFYILEAIPAVSYRVIRFLSYAKLAKDAILWSAALLMLAGTPLILSFLSRLIERIIQYGSLYGTTLLFESTDANERLFGILPYLLFLSISILSHFFPKKLFLPVDRSPSIRNNILLCFIPKFILHFTQFSRIGATFNFFYIVDYGDSVASLARFASPLKIFMILIVNLFMIYLFSFRYVKYLI